jgi:hypothetical protein
MRETRLIRPLTGDRLPSQVLLIDLIYAREQAKGARDVWNLIPVGGAAVRWRIRNGIKMMRSLVQLDLGEPFWDMLRRLCAPGTVTWAFSASAYTDWTALGLWDRVSSGAVEIDGPDVYQPEVHAGRPERRWTGYAVMENPPTIIVSRIPSRQSGLTIVDLRNYCQRFAQSWDETDARPDQEGGTEFDPPAAEWNRCLDRLARHERFLDNLFSFLQSGGHGSLKYTFSGQAYASWRTKHLDKKVLVHCNSEALALERAALYGGRCEVAFMGKVQTCRRLDCLDLGHNDYGGSLTVHGPVYQLDFNSLYPYVAGKYDMPTRLANHFGPVATDEVEKMMRDYFVIASVDVETKVPCLPWRNGDEVYYPVGRFNTSLTTPELMLAFSVGSVLAVRECSCYERANLFGPLVVDWYSERLRRRDLGDKDFADFLKLGMNGVFGKLGQRSKRWVRQPDDAAEYDYSCWWQAHPATDLPTVWRSFAGRVSYLDTEGESDSSCPSIAAAVTSYARATLWSAITAAGRENVYYYDTDSVWTNQKGYDALRGHGALGERDIGLLKVAGSYNRVEFQGIKHYEADDKIVCAGLPQGLRLGSGGYAEWLEERRLYSHLWAKRCPVAELVRKKFSAIKQYRHGVVESSGWVRPLHVKEF